MYIISFGLIPWHVCRVSSHFAIFASNYLESLQLLTCILGEFYGLWDSLVYDANVKTQVCFSD